MNKILKFAFVSLSIGLCLSAFDVAWSNDVTKSASVEQKLSLNDVVGMYSESFKNAFISGIEYQSENTLEIIEYSATSVYFQTHLEFANGHMCNLSGIAVIHGNELVYHGSIRDDGQKCEFHIKKEGDLLKFYDENAVCREHTCGSRGGYFQQTFNNVSRQKIKDENKIKTSPEFQNAVTFYSQRNQLRK